MTKNRKSYGGLERCRNFRNLNESEPDARPVPVKVDPLQADVVATKWVAPSSLSAPPSAGAGFPPGSGLKTCPSVGAVARSGDLATTWSVIAKTPGNHFRRVRCRLRRNRCQFNLPRDPCVAGCRIVLI